MIATLDLFDLYRWGLGTVCAVYAAVRICQTVYRWLVYFGGSRERAVLGQYVAVQLLRLRFRRFRWDFAQIGVLAAVLVGVIWWHYQVGASR